jgi:uncharacterized protein YyaL (SSP411 family)
MKLFFAFLLSWAALPGIWHNNLEEAKQIARKEHRHILLNFSGSDWCGPCIRMHKEILERAPFTQLADTTLVLVNADFPRSKKNQLPARQQELNNAMADQYNTKGDFPLTLLLNADGKVLKSWTGFPDIKAEAFTAQVKELIDADR